MASTGDRRRARRFRPRPLGTGARRATSTTTSSCCRPRPDGRDLAPAARPPAGPAAARRGHRRSGPPRPARPRRGAELVDAVAVDAPVVATLHARARAAWSRRSSLPTAARACPIRRAASRGRPVDRRSSTCCRPTWRRSTSPRRAASSAAAAGSTARTDCASSPRRRRARRVDGGDARRSPTADGSATSARSARPASSSTPTLYLAFGISGAVQHTAGLGAPAHIISVNTDPHCPMMADRRPGRRRRRQRCARRAAPSLVAAVAVADEPATFDAIVVGAGPAGSCAATRARPRRPRRPAARAGPVPRQQEHVRRRRLPADPRRPAPALVGRGADPAVGHPTLDHAAHRRPRRSRSTSAPRRWGEPAVQRRHGATDPTSTTGSPARPRPTAPRCCASTTVDRAAARRRRRRASACAPTAPTATLRAPIVIACDGVNSFLRQGSRALRADADADALHARREGDARAAQGA